MKPHVSLKAASQQLTLGDVAKLRSGKTPTRSQEDLWDGSVPWYTAKDLKVFHLVDSEDHISDKAVQEGAAMGRMGDLLMLVRGMTLLKDVPVCVLQRPGSFNQDLKLITPVDGVSSDYLGYVLAASKPRLRTMVTIAGHGTGRLDVERLASLPVRVPDDETQMWLTERIGVVDELIRQNKALWQLKSRYRRGLAQQLLTGKKRFPEFSGREWVSKPLSDLFEAVKRPVQWNDDEDYRLVSVRRRSGGMFLRGVAKGSSIKTKDLWVIRTGDIVISRRQVVHGAIAIVPCKFDGCYVSSSYMALVPKTGATIDPNFFEYLSSLPVMRHVAYLSSYGVHVEKLTFNQKWYMRQTIVIPDGLEEQAKIVSTLKLLAREIVLLEQQREQYELFKRGLMSRLLSGDIQVPA